MATEKHERKGEHPWVDPTRCGHFNAIATRQVDEKIANHIYNVYSYIFRKEEHQDIIMIMVLYKYQFNYHWETV